MDNVLNKYFDNLFGRCALKKDNEHIEIFDKNGNLVIVCISLRGIYHCSGIFFQNAEVIFGLHIEDFSEFLKRYLKTKLNLYVNEIKFWDLKCLNM